MSEEQALKFVESAKLPISETNKLARCVDGRYENIPDMPLAAKPGGDAGDVMALFAALNLLGQSLASDEVVKIIADSIGGEQNFRFHTDEHAENSVPGLGCGHLKQAKFYPAAYGLQQEQIDSIFEALPHLIKKGAQQETVHGDHAEQGVIVIDSEDYGIKPLLRNGEEVQEVFVYQKTLHDDQLSKIAKTTQAVLAEQGVVVEEPQVRKALDDAFGKQLTETLQRLAKDLPVYTVKISANGEVEI